LFADFDQDSQKDLFITNGYRQDITNLDFMVYGNQVLTMGTEEANRKQRLAQLNNLPEVKLHNYLYKNVGELQFQDISAAVGFTKPTYSNGAAYADFDNDGDLDLVVNNIDDPAGVFRNNITTDSTKSYLRIRFQGTAPNLEGIGSEVEIYYNQKLQKQYFTPYRGYLSSVEPVLHFGLGELTLIDSLKVTWPDGKEQWLKQLKTNQEITLHHKDARESTEKTPTTTPKLFKTVDSLGLAFTHKENAFVDYKIQPLLPHMHSKNGPGIAVADCNNDGLEDVFIGGAAGQAGILKIQEPSGIFKEMRFFDAEYEDMGALFLDADGDGDQDLYVVSGGASHQSKNVLYKDRMYQNDGTGTYKRVAALPKNFSSGSTVNAADYDKDGDLDLFVGGRVIAGEYPMSPTSMLLKNVSTATEIKFVKDEQAISQKLDTLGMVTSAIWTDFNDDTWLDLIVVGEFMPIRFFQNNSGVLTEITKQTGLKNTHGWWNSISTGDFDNDGDTCNVLLYRW